MKQQVSVIIPAYNGAEYIGEALRSALEQDHPPYEVIVIDDGSTDETEAVVRRFPDVRYFYHRRQGTAEARNAGVREAHAPLIAFLDQDDWWHPSKLRLQVHTLLRHPALGFVLCLQRFLVQPGVVPPAWLDNRSLNMGAPGLVPGAMLVRRETFQKVGFFNEEYSLSSDFDWFVRAERLGISRATVPRELFFRRIHGANQSYDVDTMFRERARILSNGPVPQREGRREIRHSETVVLSPAPRAAHPE